MIYSFSRTAAEAALRETRGIMPVMRETREPIVLQAEEIANARAHRAEQAALKSYFQQQGMTEDEVKAALADYKTNKEKQKPNLSAIEKSSQKVVCNS